MREARGRGVHGVVVRLQPQGGEQMVKRDGGGTGCVCV